MSDTTVRWVDLRLRDDAAAVEASAARQAAPFDEYRRLIAELEGGVNELCGNPVPEAVDCVAG